MALSAASIDGEHPVDNLPDSGMEFLAASVASAKSVLEAAVKSAFPHFLVAYQSLLVMHLHQLLLIWSCADSPDGVSVLFTPSCRPEAGDSRAAIAAGLESSNRAGFSLATVQSHTVLARPQFRRPSQTCFIRFRTSTQFS